jgi:acetyl-CoA C-acetyltransferase
MTLDERLFLEDRIRIPYKWPAGHIGSAFLRALRDDTNVLGSQCAQCRTVYCPPRSLCLTCFAPITHQLVLGQEGTVLCADGGLGLVLLDGATTALLHRVEAEPGDRVMIEWAAHRTGSILDIDHFKRTGSAVPVPSRYGVDFKPAGKAPRFPGEVAVVAVASTPTHADRSGWSFAEMVHEVVAEVLSQAGLTHQDVDTVISASSDFLDGRTISDMAVQDVTGAPGKSCSKVSQDGLFALLYAVSRITCGLFGTALVVAHAKASEGDPRGISQASFDPIMVRPLGLTDHVLLNLQAQRRGAAAPTLAPDSDGAVALLLASGDVARRLKSPRVWLCGAGFAMQTHRPGDCDLGSVAALRHAGRQALTAAGIRPDELHVAETMCLSSAQEKMWLDALGLLEGASGRPTSRVILNPSGGALERNPGFATGLERLASVFHHLAGSPGYGLAHAVSGYTGQNHAVWTVRSE